MRLPLISCAIAAALTMGTLAHADGDDAPSTWMLQPSPYDSPSSSSPSATSSPGDEQANGAKVEEVGGATVSFAVRNESGEDIHHARVTMDGQLLSDALQGWAVNIPPGEHVFEFAAAGYVSQDHPVTIHAGMVAELLTVALKPVELADVTAPTVMERPRYSDRLFAGDSSSQTKGDPWVVTYVAGGAAILALGIGTALGVSASDRVSTLRSTCAPNCSSGDVSSVSSEMTAADISIGVGIVSGAVAVVWALTHPRDPGHENKPSLAVTVRGLSGQF
ncbi:MAG: hypothetical protein ABI183_05805 [Polyangiaceae bacterium]